MARVFSTFAEGLVQIVVRGITSSLGTGRQGGEKFYKSNLAYKADLQAGGRIFYWITPVCTIRGRVGWRMTGLTVQ